MTGPVTHRDATAGETMVVHPTGPGGLLRVELTVEATHRRPPPGHIHPGATERFTVLDGELAVRIGRRWTRLRAGETAEVAPGTAHAYRGVPGVPARVLVELAPPGGMAEFFAAYYGVPAALRRARTGAPRLTAMAPILSAHADDITFPGLPPRLARPLFGLLGRSARP